MPHPGRSASLSWEMCLLLGCSSLAPGVMAAPVSVSLVFVGILLAQIHQSLVTENSLLILYAKLFLFNFLCVFCLLLDPAWYSPSVGRKTDRLSVLHRKKSCFIPDSSASHEHLLTTPLPLSVAVCTWWSLPETLWNAGPLRAPTSLTPTVAPSLCPS